jgi:DNA-binding winged helix-turn-helix (wHTH) protein
MNVEDLKQSSMARFPRRRNLVGEDPNGRVYRLQAKIIPEAFHFGPFRVAPYARLLEHEGSAISLGSRAFDLLCLLISRPGEIVSKSELMARTWPDVTVEESSLRFHVTQLRRALGDSPHGSGRYVVNVPGRGYCFVARVSRQAQPLKQ